MSVILLGATDAMAQETGNTKGKAVIDRVSYTLTCECGTSGIKGERAPLSPADEKLGMVIKWDFVCPNQSCKERWYTSDKNFYIPKKYPKVDDSAQNAQPRHICSEANGCLVESTYPPKQIGEGVYLRTIVRRCGSADTLIVRVTLGQKTEVYQMVGDVLEFSTTYGGNIKCEYFAPAQRRSAKKPTTQGTNGKRKRGVMLRERR